MLLRSDLCSPIPGENPAGKDIRYAPVYEKIREARREDDQLAQGAWQRERKVAEHGIAIRLMQDAIATESKDLQLAVWLIESLLLKHGFEGLAEGLDACSQIVDQFWDGFYPEIEEGDLEPRALLVDWLGSKLVVPVKAAPLFERGYGYLAYKESRTVPTEEQAKAKEHKAARDAALKEGKLGPEVIDKAIAETPKGAMLASERALDGCLAALARLDQVCQDKFGDQSPSTGRLVAALTEVRHANHGFLQKRREIDPDAPAAGDIVSAPAVQETPPSPITPVTTGTYGSAAAPAMAPVAISLPAAVPVSVAEPLDLQQAIASVSAAAAFLRAREPFSAAPYLMLRGLRWGELRSSRDASMLQAPPTEMRQTIKALALQQRWKEVLEFGESIMALACGRAWLDLQRFSVEACAALGTEYDAIAMAIRSELRTLITDLPGLIDATLTDDSPTANGQTQTWLRELLAEPVVALPELKAARLPVIEENGHRSWETKYVDSHVMALEAMRQGQHQKAFEILNREVERQRSGRGRFLRKLQLAQICLAAGKDTIAQPLIDDLAASVETHKLEDWEDRELIAGALVFLLQSSKKIQADAKLKQAMFERVCRLDPVQALAI